MQTKLSCLAAALLVVFVAPRTEAANNLLITSGTDTNVTAGPNFTTTGDSASLRPITIATLWATSAVTISTGAAGANTQLGDITIGAVIDTTTTFGLTITATHNLSDSTAAIASHGTGSISLNAGGGINLGADVSTVGGNISLSASGAGGIVANSADASNTLANGNAGSITLQADGTGANDGISFSGGLLAVSSTSNGGNVTLTASGGLGITTGLGIATGSDGVAANGAHGGNITLTALAGAIDTSAGTISTSGGIGFGTPISGSAHAGNVTMQAAGDIRISQVYAFSNPSMNSGQSGNGGNVQLTSGASIFQSQNFEQIDVSSILGTSGDAGWITLLANGTGASDGISLHGSLLAVSSTGYGGDVSLTASGGLGITTGLGIATGSDGVAANGAHGGNIALTALAGAIDTSAGTISTSGGIGFGPPISGSAHAGNVTMQAAGDIRISQVYAFSNPSMNSGQSGNGGNVQLTSGASILQSQNFEQIDVSSILGTSGDAGWITLLANGTDASDGISLHGSVLAVSSAGYGGDVSLTASGGLGITTGLGIATGSDGVAANGAHGGNITLTALAGAIDTSAGTISTSGGAPGYPITGLAKGGNITMQAAADIKATLLYTFGQANGAGGAIQLTAGGEIRQESAGYFDSSGYGTGAAGAITLHADTIHVSRILAISGSGNGGAVNLTATGAGGSIFAGDISTGSDGVAANGARGGDIDITALAGSVQLGAVISTTQSSAVFGHGNAGNITVQANNDMTLDNLWAFSELGHGGSIHLTAGFSINQTGLFPGIDNRGATGSGEITLDAPAMLVASIFTNSITTTFSSQNITVRNVQSSGTLLIQPQTGQTATAVEVMGEVAAGEGLSFSLGAVGSLKVDSGASLRGSGTVDGQATILGTLAPSVVAPGTLTFTGDVDASLAEGFEFQLGVAASDKIALTNGTLTIDSLGLDDFQFMDAGDFAPGTYRLFDTTHPIIGALDPGNLTGLVFGYQATLSFTDGGNDISLMVVPEPGSAALLITGGFAVVMRFHRRCSRRQRDAMARSSFRNSRPAAGLG